MSLSFVELMDLKRMAFAFPFSRDTSTRCHPQHSHIPAATEVSTAPGACCTEPQSLSLAWELQFAVETLETAAPLKSERFVIETASVDNGPVTFAISTQENLSANLSDRLCVQNGKRHALDYFLRLARV
ncbi:hypothetical protein P7K49_027184 [Saguinus oedipus]|uniref:Uncharacterized protein n=1 Tax=Saguinus oedipus TaxID=9490 RepID=A0ABQ9UGS7_SAGOE|nr:hypothetical protein P7K49_027184 [Saguinus oedipus]